MSSADQSFRSLFSELVSEITNLIRQELRLAQAEASEKVTQAQRGAVTLVAGLLIAFVALIILAQALVLGLSNVVEPWLASVIVGVVLAIVGFALVKGGQSSLKPENLPGRWKRSFLHLPGWPRRPSGAAACFRSSSS